MSDPKGSLPGPPAIPRPPGLPRPPVCDCGCRCICGCIIGRSDTSGCQFTFMFAPFTCRNRIRRSNGRLNQQRFQQRFQHLVRLGQQRVERCVERCMRQTCCTSMNCGSCRQMCPRCAVAIAKPSANKTGCMKGWLEWFADECEDECENTYLEYGHLQAGIVTACTYSGA